jgi:hypothetical protein
MEMANSGEERCGLAIKEEAMKSLPSILTDTYI